MENGRDLDRITESLYKSASDAAGWRDALQNFARLIGAIRIAILNHDFVDQKGEFEEQVGFDEKCVEIYGSTYAASNVWLRSERPLATDHAFVGTDLVPVWELVRTAFYKDWLRPQGMLHAIIGVIDLGRSALRGVLALRPSHGAPFGETECAATTSLLPHLRHAFDFRSRIAQEAARSQALMDLLDEMPEAVFLVDAACRVCYRNRAAEAVLGRNDGLTLAKGCLAAAQEDEALRLRAIVAATVDLRGGRSGARGSGTCGGHMLVSRGGGALPIVVSIAGRRHLLPDDSLDGAAVVAVFVRDPAQARGLSTPQLRELFQMTRAEATLASMIVAGHGLWEAASILGVTRNTVRTHMKHIYAKTDTHRQADLQRLLDAAVPEPDAADRPPHRDGTAGPRGAAASAKRSPRRARPRVPHLQG